MMKRSKLANKFIALGALLALALAVPVVPLLMGYSQQISDTEKERIGVQVHRELRAMLQDIQRHRGASTSFLTGKTEFKERVEKARAGVDAAQEKANAAIVASQKELGQFASWNEFKPEWQKLKTDFTSLKPQENAQQHNALIQKLLLVMDKVADLSGLVLDPELESYYLMDLAVVNLPPATERMGQSRALGSLVLSEKSLEGGRRDALVGSVYEIGLREKSIVSDAQKVFEANPQTAIRLKEPYEGARKGIADFKMNIGQNLLEASSLAYEPGRFFDQATQAIDASFKFYDVAVIALDDALMGRIERLRSQRMMVLLMSFGLIAVATGLAFIILRRVNRSIVSAAGAMGQIAGGNLNVSLKPESNDEIGGLIDSINDMQRQLRERLDNERNIANETLRLKVALDVSSNSVMVANPDGMIIYCNAALFAMMRQAEADIRTELPNFRVDTIIGSNFDNYHKHPDHQRNLLAALKASHHSEVRIGKRSFVLVANPIINPAGDRLGTVVEWCDRTAEVHIEGNVSEIIHAAAVGDFGKRLETQQMGGFFKSLSEGINGLLEANSNALADVGVTLKSLSQGDLTHKIDTEYQGTLGKLKDDTNATVDQLQSIILSIKQAADAINIAAREIATGNQDLSSRTEEQASSLEETASSMEQLTNTVKQNADNAAQANQLAIRAQKVAVEGGEIVAKVVDTMHAIHQSSRRIADIISVIDGIAFQTNILALNAAVEAARAGEQGRGFAVVATEVRNLAQRSAGAAKEIKELISDSVSKVEAGNTHVGQAGHTMESVVASIRQVASIIGEISEASREQSSGIEQVKIAITQMDSSTQQNAALVEQAAAAAESLEEQAGNLGTAVSVFKLTQTSQSSMLKATDKVGNKIKHINHEPQVAQHKKLIPATLDDEWSEF